MYQGKYGYVIGREMHFLYVLSKYFQAMGFFRANHNAVLTLVHQTTEFRQTTGCIHNDTVRQSSGCPCPCPSIFIFLSFFKTRRNPRKRFGSGRRFYTLSLKRRPSPRGLAHFVAGALQNIPIRALKLEDGNSYIDVPRGFPAWIRRASRISGVAPKKPSRTKRRNNPCLFFARPRPRLKKNQPATCSKRFFLHICTAYLYRYNMVFSHNFRN